ncbi:MAG: hypothetical protein D6797_00150 [Bdellovibrio sp.]|nr:MAG: hypothetical protein D6797_00150 [Bdellovibrio sp.]
MRKIKNIFLTLVTLSFTACGGGGGGSVSTGGRYMTHAEVAQDFVYRLNVDAGFDVELVKTNTAYSDYIVVYDWDLGTYDAYYIGDYVPGENVISYLNLYDSSFYYDLDPIGGGYYQDYYTGVVFEKVQNGSSKNLMQMAAIKEMVQIDKAAKTLEAEYGLSKDRSREVAQLAVQIANAPKGSLTDEDYDNFAKEILGSSITEFQEAIKKSMEGDKSDLDSLLEVAADVNGVSPEAVDQIVSDIFGGKN